MRTDTFKLSEVDRQEILAKNSKNLVQNSVQHRPCRHRSCVKEESSPLLRKLNHMHNHASVVASSVGENEINVNSSSVIEITNGRGAPNDSNHIENAKDSNTVRKGTNSSYKKLETVQISVNISSKATPSKTISVSTSKQTSKERIIFTEGPVLCNVNALSLKESVANSEPKEQRLNYKLNNTENEVACKNGELKTSFNNEKLDRIHTCISHCVANITDLAAGVKEFSENIDISNNKMDENIGHSLITNNITTSLSVDSDLVVTERYSQGYLKSQSLSSQLVHSKLPSVSHFKPVALLDSVSQETSQQSSYQSISPMMLNGQTMLSAEKKASYTRISDQFLLDRVNTKQIGTIRIQPPTATCRPLCRKMSATLLEVKQNSVGKIATNAPVTSASENKKEARSKSNGRAKRAENLDAKQNGDVSLYSYKTKSSSKLI